MSTLDSATPELLLLAPPSPPAAPHLGGVYTWCLLDAARRIAHHFGTAATLPQSWNMASRRLEPAFGDNPEGFTDYCNNAVRTATSALASFGAEMSTTIALRDDEPIIQEHVRAIIRDLATTGVIRYLPAEEKWCESCQLALPPTATTESCFTCGKYLVHRTSQDWFLILPMEEIMRRAETIRWIPGYGARRLLNLADVHPLLRVNHPQRSLGISSPLRHGDIIDPRLVGALGPSILRRLGIDSPIVAVAGFDIQRKWLLPLLAANPTGALPSAIVHHGTLLDPAGRKLSRYSGASLADAPADVEPCLVRAALLAAPLGKDLRAAELPTAGASRLREKVLNSLRFIQLQDRLEPLGIDLDTEIGPPLADVETYLQAYDVPRAYASFQRAITHHLSATLIPKIRKNGLAPGSTASSRIASLHRIFYGEEPRLAAKTTSRR